MSLARHGRVPSLSRTGRVSIIAAQRSATASASASRIRLAVASATSTERDTTGSSLPAAARAAKSGAKPGWPSAVSGPSKCRLTQSRMPGTERKFCVMAITAPGSAARRRSRTAA